MQAVRFAASDGFELSGQRYGDTSTARAAVLVAPAMGVPQRFYSDFAEWLASHGLVVLSFDYRGIGASRPEAMKHSLKGLRADVNTWAGCDAAAALAWLDAQLAPATPIHWLGHSLGGQIVGMVPNRDRISRIVSIAVGTGYWLHNTFTARMYVWWLWFVVAPLAMPLFGYFPGKRLRKIGDLPLGVMRQWRRWCLNRDYLVGVEGPRVRETYAAITTPLLSLSFTDDEYMSATSTNNMHGFYASAPREMRRIAPKDIGVKRIGHFGFFRKKFAPTLWPQVSQWLAEG